MVDDFLRFLGVSRKKEAQAAWDDFVARGGEDLNTLVWVVWCIYAHLRASRHNRCQWVRRLDFTSDLLLLTMLFGEKAPSPKHVGVLASSFLYLKSLENVAPLGTSLHSLCSFIRRALEERTPVPAHVRILLQISLAQLTMDQEEGVRVAKDLCLHIWSDKSYRIHYRRQRARVFRGYALLMAELGEYREAFRALIRSHASAGRLLDVHIRNLMATGRFLAGLRR